MKKYLLFFALTLSLVPIVGYGQGNTTFVPFLATGYTYQFVSQGSSLTQKFYKLGPDTGTGWSRGNGAFGTLNNTSSPPCPLNDAAHVKTIWPSSKDVLIRRHIVLPAGTKNVKVKVAIDDAVKVFFNGQDVSGGVKTHNTCASETGDFNFTVPDNILKSGDNLIAVWGDWESAKNYLDIQVSGDVPVTLSLTTAGTGSGSVSKSPDQQAYAANSQVALTATPSVSSDFTGWSGDASGSTNPLTITMNANKSITANFALKTFQLTVTKTEDLVGGFNSGLSSVTSSPSPNAGTNYTYNTTVTLTAVPAQGWDFAGWTGNATGPQNPTTVTMTATRSVTANFKIKRFSITPQAVTNGSITPSAPVTGIPYMGSSTFKIDAAQPGFHVESIIVDNSTPIAVSTQPTSTPSTTNYTVDNVIGDRTIGATFAVNYYLLTQQFDQTMGSVSVTANATPNQGYYKDGTVVTLKALSLSGYHFIGWTGVSTGSEMLNPLDLTMNENKTIGANFEVNAPQTFVVSGLDDSGPGSLRAALDAANAHPGPDVITFGSTVSGTISLSSPLPILSDELTVTGATGPGAGPLVTLQPSVSFASNPALPNGFQLSGVFLSWGYTPQQTTISGLRITGFPGSGISIGSDNNRIIGCVITGNAGDGVSIIDGNGNLIGGTNPGEGNEIYANGGNGVAVRQGTAALPPANNAILSNRIYSNVGLGIDLGGVGMSENVYGTPSNPLAHPASPAALTPQYRMSPLHSESRCPIRLYRDHSLAGPELRSRFRYT
jgi:uncharacterized repeat protein (TIGR02543 family)